MDLRRIRIHHLIERLGDDEIESVWLLLQELYSDSYILKAIQEAKWAQQPGDSLTHEEAIELLRFL